jgi:Glycosyl hydrolase family 26
VAAGGVAGLPDPKQRMLLGAYLNLKGQRSVGASVASRVKAMGRPYDLEATYYNWTDPFPGQSEAAMAAAGTTPLIAWYLPDKDPGAGISLNQVTSGADDKWISTQAAAIKAFGHRVFLRLAPEMNGDWYGYSASPTAYIAAWRHIWEVFKRTGATNVTWVWCPNLGPSDWTTYYPGNKYVDVIGVDGFSNVDYTWQTFQQMFGGFFAHFAAFAPGKPQLVAETATNSGAGTPAAGVGSAASFISGMATYLQDIAGPKYDVIGVCWFDTDTNNGHNWRVDQTAASWQAWLNLARRPYFGGHGSG